MQCYIDSYALWNRTVLLALLLPTEDDDPDQTPMRQVTPPPPHYIDFDRISRADQNTPPTPRINTTQQFTHAIDIEDRTPPNISGNPRIVEDRIHIMTVPDQNLATRFTAQEYAAIAEPDPNSAANILNDTRIISL